MRRTFQVLVLTVAMGVGFGATAPPASAAPKPKPAVVTLDGTGVTGGWDATTFFGSVRCRAGAVDPSLAVTVTQGAVVGTTVMSSVTCDGKDHRFSIDVWPSSAARRFDVGNSWVEAELTVHDPKTGAPLRVGTDANNVWIRPSGKIQPLWPLIVNGDGTLTVNANALCRGPWFITNIGVEVQQPGDPVIGASGYLADPDVPCDGKKHRVQFILDPPEGKSFAAKPSRVDLSLDMLDPVHFDPVDQWWWRGNVAVVRR